MKKWKTSKLFVRIFASLMCIVAFSSLVLIVASSLFTAKYENLLYQQNEKTIEAINEQLTQNIQSVYELCEVILDNQIVMENFRPYSETTASQRYHYSAIVNLLRQGRLQMNGLIDSLFLYTDMQKVLYAQEERGMADFNVFFDKLFCFSKYNAEFWRDCLNMYTRSRYSKVLAPDTYHSDKANDQRTVIPVLYSVRGTTSKYLLVINLSLDNILKQYEIIEVYPEVQYAVYTDDGALIAGDIQPTESVKTINNKVSLDGGKYYRFEVAQDSLHIKILFYLPQTAIGMKVFFYRSAAMLLIGFFSALGVILVLKASRNAYAPIEIVKKDIQSLPDGKQFAAAGNEIDLIRNTLLRLNDERSMYQSRNRLHSEHYMVQSIVSLLEGKPVNDMAFFNMLLTKDYGFSGASFFCAGLVMDLDDGEDYVLRKELVDQIKDCIETTLSQSMPLLCFAYQSNMLILLADGKENATEKCRETMKKVKTLYENSCNLRCGVGGCVSTPEEIMESYYQANTEILLSDSDYQASGEFAYDQNEVRNAAFTRDIVQIEEVAQNILERAKQHRLSYRDIAGLLDDISKTIIDTLRRLNANHASFLPQKENISALKVLLLYPEINLSPLTVAVLPHITASAAEPESSTYRLANQVKKYIEDHFQEELSLDILADKMEISPKYLSRIFKQSIGVNLSEYLMYIRIENAKKMLLADMSMKDVMEKIGMNNRTTFTRAFKRLEGITPNEYRILHKQIV